MNVSWRRIVYLIVFFVILSTWLTFLNQDAHFITNLFATNLWFRKSNTVNPSKIAVSDNVAEQQQFISYIIGLESKHKERTAKVLSGFEKLLQKWKADTNGKLPPSANILRPQIWKATVAKHNSDFNSRQMACLLSHVKLFEHLIRIFLDGPVKIQDPPPVMVFEDDVYCLPEIINELDPFFSSLPENWDIAYLGGKPMTRPIAPDGSENINTHQPWWRVYFMSNTHAYMVHPKAWRTIVDEWNMAIYHGSGEFVDAVLSRLETKKIIVAYMPPLPMCQQERGFSEIEQKEILHPDIRQKRAWLLGLKGEGKNPRHWYFHSIPPNPPRPGSEPKFISFIIGLKSKFRDRTAKVLDNFKDLLFQWNSKTDGNLPPVAQILRPTIWEATLARHDTFDGRQLACLKSHLFLFEHLIKVFLDSPERIGNAPYVVVWEDDVYCVPEITKELERFVYSLPENWDIAYFGGKPMSRPTAPDGTENINLDQSWWRVYYMSNTHAYMVNPKAWRTIVKSWSKVVKNRPGGIYVDTVLSKLERKKRIIAYMPPRPLCQQEPSFSVIEQRKVHHHDIRVDERLWLMGLKGEGEKPRHWYFHLIPPSPPRPEASEPL